MSRPVARVSHRFPLDQRPLLESLRRFQPDQFPAPSPLDGQLCTRYHDLGFAGRRSVGEPACSGSASTGASATSTGPRLRLQGRWSLAAFLGQASSAGMSGPLTAGRSPCLLTGM